MKNIHEIANAIFRKRNSIFFRLLCVVYGVLIILFSAENYYPLWAYFLAMIGYVVIYVLLLFKNDKIRLIFDYLFIIFVVYGKPIGDISITVFVLFPIFNAINFSGKKRNPYILLVCSLIVYYFLSISMGKINYSSILIAFLGLFCIDYYSSLRWKLNILSQRLLDRIDDFYVILGKPHSIYSKAISDINDFLGREYVQNVFCLIKDEKQGFQIVNSSTFIFQFSLLLDEKKATALLNNDIITNIDFKYDNSLSIHNIVYPIVSTQNDEVCTYVFIVTLDSKLSFYWFLSGFIYLIEPFFNRVAKVLHNEKKLNDIKRETLKDIGNKARFVEQAVNTMHFIRNRLTPYKTLLELLEQKQQVRGDMANKIDEMIKSQCKTARQELNQIIFKANYLLEKDNNPFNYRELSYFSLGKIFSQIRSLWFESFEDSSFVTTNFNADVSEKYKIYSNFEGLDILFSDWITNMSKYKNQYSSCEVKIDNSLMKLIFTNDYTNTEQNIKELVDDLNSDDRQQIMRRTTHGLYIMKQIIQELNIGHKAYKKKCDNMSVLILELNIILHKEEDDE